MKETKELTVSFPTTGLPKDRELLGAELRTPLIGEWMLYDDAWYLNNYAYERSFYFVVILGQVEVWEPCTPEDALAKMLDPASRVIRIKISQELLDNIISVRKDCITRRFEFLDIHQPIVHTLSDLEVLRSGESK